MRRGLIFGKFLPLHHGHELVIDTALAECDDVTVVVYDSHPPGDYPRMPLGMRLMWVRELYPQIENVLGVPDPLGDNEFRDEPEYAPTYAKQLEFLGKFDRVYTSEPEYERFAHEIGAQHRLVDAARTIVPISGTAIREHPFAARGFMDWRVYSSLIQKVAFVGTESAGKSTLAAAAAEVYDTLWTHEFGRELWEAQGLTGTFADHLKMARRQYDRETAALRAAKTYLFCDTVPWTTLQWSLMTYGYADDRLYQLVNHTMDEYIWVMCANDFDFVQDGTRELVDGRAAIFQQQQIEDLRARGVDFFYVDGSVDERLEQLSSILRMKAAVPS